MNLDVNITYKEVRLPCHINVNGLNIPISFSGGSGNEEAYAIIVGGGLHVHMELGFPWGTTEEEMTKLIMDAVEDSREDDFLLNAIIAAQIDPDQSQWVRPYRMMRTGELRCYGNQRVGFGEYPFVLKGVLMNATYSKVNGKQGIRHEGKLIRDYAEGWIYIGNKLQL